MEGGREYKYISEQSGTDWVYHLLFLYIRGSWVYMYLLYLSRFAVYENLHEIFVANAIGL